MLSIMMVTYNRLELTKQTFQNLFDTTKIPYRLIVVDNASKDNTTEYLQQLIKPENCKTINLLFNDTNKGIGIGRNQALKIADEYQDDYLATLDNDVLLPNNALEECIDIIQTNTKIKLSIGVNFEDQQFPIISKEGKSFQYKKEGNLGSACMVFPFKLHKLLGYFNTEYGMYACEDSDWGFRARVIGYELGYISRPGVHIGGVNEDKEYRAFKDKLHAAAVKPFERNCSLYYQGRKSYFIPYKDN